MENYYLMVQNLDDMSVKPLKIKSEWFKKDSNYESYQNDIAAIDIVTTKFKSMEQLKQRLYPKYIDTLNVDIFITHKRKSYNKEFIEYELLFNQNDRNTFLNKKAHERINGLNLKGDDTDHFLNQFIAKCRHNQNFYFFVIFVADTKINKYLRELVMSVIDKNVKFNIHTIKNNCTDYMTLRSIVYMWNTYDTLEAKYSNSDKQKGLKIMDDYTHMIKQQKRKDSYNALMERMDKDYIEGQMTLDDFGKGPK